MARILIVEDDRVLIDIMSRQLEAKGHEVVWAFDGLEALGKIYSAKFDLVIIEVVLPHIDGALLLNNIRRRSPGSLALMLYSPGEIEMAVRSLRYGAFDIIRKPFDEEEFEKSVESALEERSSMKNSGYVYRDSRRKDASLIKRGIINAITDSLLAAAAICLGFWFQGYFPEMLGQPSFTGQLEPLRLSLGLGFCYAFIFVYKRSHRTDLISSGREFAVRIWRNLSMSYIMFLGILSLTSDISIGGGRVAIGIGYVLGLLFLSVNRFLLLPGLMTGIWREGRKSIVIARSDKKAAGTFIQADRRPDSGNVISAVESNGEFQDKRGPNTRLIRCREDMDQILSSDTVEELHIAGGILSATEMAGLLDRFRGRKLKIVLLDDRGEVRDRAGIESPTS